MKRGLIVIDVQNDYFKGGSMELVAMDKAASNCKRLLNAFRTEQAPLFYIQHISTQDHPTFFAPNTPGCRIHNSIQPQEREVVLIKHYPNSFRETDLNAHLQKAGVEEVVVCGAMSQMCVDSTTRAAFDLGYKCHVISDACATKDLEFDGQLVKASEVQAAFMAALRAPFAQISSTDQFLDNQ
ncbi:Streptothricin hydrolase [Acaryochloris thomasi RCC1774]|uniref:Streptothricin hydrolase n=1 Tax=Acaryochloris thomasi RCC1774 TaxID=1764569 RepID=A0A2W1JEF4_9CYAN|nr:cysteine hydrolase family protein [Acaryochloris thomasi]PZD72170.1 Streptothricin hydrolase [Acaryochloris thomasi RCC1774]